MKPSKISPPTVSASISQANETTKGIKETVQSLGKQLVENGKIIIQALQQTISLISTLTFSDDYDQVLVFFDLITNRNTPFFFIEQILNTIPSLVNQTHFNCADNALSYLLRNRPDHPNLLKLVNLFLKKGVKLNQEDRLLKTPFHYFCEHAAASPDALEILKTFLGNKININKTTDNNSTPLHLLFKDAEHKTNLPELSRILLNKRAWKSLKVSNDKIIGEYHEEKKIIHYTPLGILLHSKKTDSEPQILETIAMVLNQNKVLINLEDWMQETIKREVSEYLKKDATNASALACQQALMLFPYYYLVESYTLENLKNKLQSNLSIDQVQRRWDFNTHNNIHILFYAIAHLDPTAVEWALQLDPNGLKKPDEKINDMSPLDFYIQLKTVAEGTGTEQSEFNKACNAVWNVLNTQFPNFSQDPLQT